MEILNVLIAAIAAFAFGAAWYMVLAKQWMAASGVAVGADGRPANAAGPMPYIIAFVAVLLVAGMMRHVLAGSGIGTIPGGALAGLGIGAFLAVPWLATCYAFSGRPAALTVIDGGYATIGSAVIGAVLTAF